MLEDRFLGALNRAKARLAVLLRVLVDRVDNAVAPTHLDRLKVALMVVHVLENVGLQVAIDDVDGAAGHILRRHFERLQYLLHRLKGCLR